MSIKLDCPVCGYKEIEKDVCPNCDTDLSLIRMLQELPQLDVSCLEIPPTPLTKGGFVPSFLRRAREDRVLLVPSFLRRAREDRTKITTRQLVTAAIILLIGMGLGTLGSFLFLQPQQIAAITPNNPVVITSPSPQQSPILISAPKESSTYTVKPGDNLSLITGKLCIKGTDWRVMVGANPQLKGRENYIDKGEVFKIPNCKEAI